MTRIFKTILLLCALLCFIFAISSCGEEPRSTYPERQNIDTLAYSMPQALRVVPGTSWARWNSGDSILLNGFALMSQDAGNSKERIVTDSAVLAWLVAVLPDSFALSGYADTLRLSNDTLYISGQNYVLLSDYRTDTSDIIINTELFGAVGDGTSDNTEEIQAALNYASAVGGGTVLLPRGTVLVSNDSSSHANAMLLIPEGVSLIGHGRGRTILTRAASKRGNNGIFICPMGYDTATAYNASGNFRIADFTITDGAITPNRANGDLIALAHAQNVIIERMGFGNHDQHAVDIHGSKNIIIRDNVAVNNVVASSACATFQVEAALSGGVWGSNADGTGSRDIFIYNNHVTNTGAANTFHIFHGTTASQQNFTNVHVYSNYIDGGYISNSDVIGTDDNMYSNVDGFYLHSNRIVCNHQESRAVNFYGQYSSASYKNVIFSKNQIRGTGRAGIYLGGDGSGKMSVKNVEIEGNAIELNSGTSTASRYAVTIWGVNGAVITDNIVEYTGTTIPTNGSIITLQSSTDVVFSNNRISHSFANASAGSGVVYVSDPESTGIEVEGNGNYIETASLGSASFASQIKKVSLTTNDIININSPVDPQSVTGAATNAINFNRSTSGVISIDMGSTSTETVLSFYNPKAGGQYKFYIKGASSDSIVFPANVQTYEGDTLDGRIVNNGIYNLYYDGTNYIADDTIFQGYDSDALLPLLLDTYSGSVAAYSLRPLYMSWSDSTLITVRRSSDNSEQDFTGAEITDGTLTTFTGGGDGFVKVIRDQSGNGYDLSQTTTANQPKIVNSGSLITKNSMPAIQFDGTNDGLGRVVNPFGGSSAGSGFSVFSFTNASGAGREIPWGVQDNTGAAYDFLIARQSDDNRLESYIEGDFRDNPSGTAVNNTNAHTVSLIYDNAVIRSIYLDGTLNYNASAAIGTLTDGTDLYIGQQIGGSNFFNGLFQELILFDSNQSGNRTGIESNQSNYWGI